MEDDHIKRLFDLYQTVDVLADLKKAETVIVFGAGNAGRYVKESLSQLGIDVFLFCDNDERKWSSLLDGIKIVSPNEMFQRYLQDGSNTMVCIACTWARDVARQLYGMGVKRFVDLTPHMETSWQKDTLTRLGELERVDNLLVDEESRETLVSLLEHRISLDPTKLKISPHEAYFHPETLPLPNQVILDCGAWQGDTALKFAGFLKNNCKVIAFEPDEENYGILAENIEKEGLAKVVLPINAGVYDTNRRLGIYQKFGNSISCSITEKGDSIEVVAIDTFVVANALVPGLIKMDIEGSEHKALLGARETIQKYKPRLQISVYHNSDDLWRIPLFINQLSPNSYRYYLAHHGLCSQETILYAVPRCS